MEIPWMTLGRGSPSLNPLYLTGLEERMLYMPPGEKVGYKSDKENNTNATTKIFIFFIYFASKNKKKAGHAV